MKMYGISGGMNFINKSKTTKIEGFSFKRAKSVKFAHPVWKLLKEISDQITTQKSKPSKQYKVILQFISKFYNEKINTGKNNREVANQEMQEFIYDFYLKQFGLKKMAVNKFIDMMKNSYAYSDLGQSRAKLFIKCMGIHSDPFTCEEFNLWLTVQDLILNEITTGGSAQCDDVSPEWYVPLERCTECFSRITKNKLEQLTFNECITSIEKLANENK